MQRERFQSTAQIGSNAGGGGDAGTTSASVETMEACDIALSEWYQRMASSSNKRVTHTTRSRRKPAMRLDAGAQAAGVKTA